MTPGERAFGADEEAAAARDFSRERRPVGAERVRRPANVAIEGAPPRRRFQGWLHMLIHAMPDSLGTAGLEEVEGLEDGHMFERLRALVGAREAEMDVFAHGQGRRCQCRRA